jgi:hypothetical protein
VKILIGMALAVFAAHAQVTFERIRHAEREPGTG